MIAYITTFRKQRRPTTQLFSLQSMQLQTFLRSVTTLLWYPILAPVKPLHLIHFAALITIQHLNSGQIRII